MLILFKGIGLAIVRNLALAYPSSSSNHGPFLVYLTSRSKERGEEALSILYKDEQLLRAKALRKDGGLTDVKLHTLDISQTRSIQELREFLKTEHPEGVDIVVNNAGIAMDGFSTSSYFSGFSVAPYRTQNPPPPIIIADPFFAVM